MYIGRKSTMSNSIIQMTWKRPDFEYPKVWHRFKARDLNSDKFVEYRIEDLLETRADEVFEHMKVNYFPDEPISQATKILITLMILFMLGN